jgi:DedD protein
MEWKLKERLVGAAVLVIVGVLVIPLLLDGPEHSAPVSVGLKLPASADNETRSHTIHLGTDAKPRTTPSSGTISRPTRSTPDSAEVQPETPAKTPAPAKPLPIVAKKAPEIAVQETKQAPVEPVQSETSPEHESTPPAKQSAPRDGWSVQIGAFGSKANVVRLRKDLETAGYSTFVVPLERNNRMLDAVRVGPVDSIEAARQLATRLKNDGHNAAVVRNDL